MKEIFKNVKEKLTVKYLEQKNSKNAKKFKPRIKARLRKNKQLISKRIDNFFDWIKGAELVELKNCNTNEDPVRPELDNDFRTRYGRKIFGVKYKNEIHAVMCFAYTNEIPKSVEELDKRSEAFEVILDAKEQGLTRFIGITGHDLGAPKAHLEAIRRYDVDTVMLPIYPRVWADPVYRADTEKLFAECADRDVGVMAIKAVAWRPWGERQPDAMSWYEPQRTKSEIERGINFALSTPGVHCFCTPSDLNTARLAIESARNFISLTENEHAAVIEEVEADEIIFPLSEHAVPLGKNISGSQPLSGN